jgi:decaprenylphospho-beta-D-ribofuranose 2-oxidase
MEVPRVRIVAPKRTTFISFDGGVAESAEYQRPDHFRLIESDRSQRPRIARGGGYSYAAASFGRGSLVLDMACLNRVLRFDEAMKLVEVEAGLTLGDLMVLTAPRGLWLPVQPGYPEITIGGCIAANVHGKNPLREGTFERSVVDVTLFHPRHGTIRLDAGAKSILFDLTCGGYGLTGVVISATLRLEPLPGPAVSLRRVPIGSLVEGLEFVRSAAVQKAFAYTWHDGTPSARSFGSGFVFEGDIPSGAPPAAPVPPDYYVLTASKRARLPFSLWNSFTSRFLTTVFRRLEDMKPERVTLPLFDALFPLARRPEYFLLFGRRGLAEFQVLVPHASIDGFLAELQERVLASEAPVVMVSLKPFGGNQRLLRFGGDGVCVTVNLVRSTTGLGFMRVLDEMTVAAKGLPHIIKDSRLPASVVRACYPEYDRFRSALLAHDPARVFRSELSARLGL